MFISTILRFVIFIYTPFFRPNPRKIRTFLDFNFLMAVGKFSWNIAPLKVYRHARYKALMVKTVVDPYYDTFWSIFAMYQYILIAAVFISFSHHWFFEVMNEKYEGYRSYIIILISASCYLLLSYSSIISWWRHQMETFSALLALCAWNSPVTGEFHTQRPVTRSFDVFFDLRLNKLLSKQS